MNRNEFYEAIAEAFEAGWDHGAGDSGRDPGLVEYAELATRAAFGPDLHKRDDLLAWVEPVAGTTALADPYEGGVCILAFDTVDRWVVDHLEKAGVPFQAISASKHVVLVTIDGKDLR